MILPLISALVSSLRDDLDQARIYRRHIFAPSDRFLLNGILWKLATGLRWQDLDTLATWSGGRCCARACQQLYHHLYKTGCMRAIYDQLYKHLHLSGGTTLEEMVAQGCFGFKGTRVILAPDQELTWQKFTALLLLQRMQHNDRCLKRRQNLACPYQDYFFRLPSVSLPRLPALPPQPRPHPLLELHPALLVFPGCLPLTEQWTAPPSVPRLGGFIPLEQAPGWSRLEPPLPVRQPPLAPQQLNDLNGVGFSNPSR